MTRPGFATLVTVIGVICLAAASAGLIYLVKEWADQPTVYKSWSTQKCVKVDDPARTAEGLEPRGSCARLPPSYELVWVN